MDNNEPKMPSRARFEVYLGNHADFWDYLFTYHNAFSRLIEDLERRDEPADMVSFPMLFMVRHCLELGFKANIRHFRKYSGQQDQIHLSSHHLEELLKAFRRHMDGTIKQLEQHFKTVIDKDDHGALDEYFSKAEELIEVLHSLDRGSYAFRYPVDKKNKRVFAPEQTINLLDVKAAFDEVMLLLQHTADVFKKYTDYADQIQEAYQEELRSAYGVEE